MKLSSLIGHLAELLDLALRSPHAADRVAAEYFAHRRYLGSRDRRWIADRLYALLRHHLSLERVVAQALAGAASPPAALPLLLVAALEARRGETPLPALADEFAAPWRLADLRVEPAAFLARAADPALPDLTGLPPEQALAVAASLPVPLAAEFIARFGLDEAHALASALNTGAPLALRVNTLRCTAEECRAALAAEGVATVPGRWAPHALVAAKRFAIPASAAFRRGMFEVQDEGSQLVVMLLDPRPGETVLDACAGGGGKTLAAAAAMRNEGVIMAEDVNDGRLKAVRERCGRAGVTIAAVQKSGAGSAATADRVLVDAPCSGVGTFRRNPGAKLRFLPEESARYAALQRRILDAAAGRVRPGGRLVYATCTLLRAENEDVAGDFLASHPGFAAEDAAALLASHGVAVPPSASAPHLLLLPHRTGTDGFFAAVFARRA